MSRFLVYVSPAVGHTLPLVPGLLELQRRGHDVHIKAMPALVDVLRAAGLNASPVDASVTDVPVTDYLASGDADKLRSGQVDLMARGKHDGPDLARAIESYRPDVLLVDTNAYGARAHAEASGLPWATLLPSVVPLPGAGIPPYGPGLVPRRGPLGWVRDRIIWKVMERVFGKAMLPGLNALRTEVGLTPYRSPLDQFDPPGAVIALTSEPLEYPRSNLPDHIHPRGHPALGPAQQSTGVPGRAGRAPGSWSPAPPSTRVTRSWPGSRSRHCATSRCAFCSRSPTPTARPTSPLPRRARGADSCHTGRSCRRRRPWCVTAAWAS